MPRSTYHEKWREANREKIAAYRKQRARRLRLAALAAYGSKCACCGLDNEWFLSIDHVENNGADHRRETGMKGSGDHLYRWLAKNSYPPGFQVLCYNCNLGKARNGGVCPHQTRGGETVSSSAHDARFSVQLRAPQPLLIQ